MHFNDIREAQKNQDVNTDESEHEWEIENLPTLHSGFTTGSSKSPKFHVLFMSLWYRDGSYIVRLQDRENGEKCYEEVSSLENMWRELEIKFTAGRLKWRDDTGNSKNSGDY